MHISENLRWIEPFLVEVKYLLPNFDKIRKIVTQKPRINLVQRSYAQTHAQKDGYTIVIFSHKREQIKSNSLKFKFKQYSKISILESLAHELTHTSHWDHTPERVVMESFIMMIFADILKSNGYVSEEEE